MDSKSNVSSVKAPTIGSTPTFFLYFDLCLYTAYAAHYVFYKSSLLIVWATHWLK